MLHQAHGMPRFVTENAYSAEPIGFKKTVREDPVLQVPDNANIIGSHVLYKIKKCDSGTFLLKAGIAQHGNEDNGKHFLKTDSTTCPPVGFHILFSLPLLVGGLSQRLISKAGSYNLARQHVMCTCFRHESVGLGIAFIGYC